MPLPQSRATPSHIWRGQEKHTIPPARACRGIGGVMEPRRDVAIQDTRDPGYVHPKGRYEAQPGQV
ncbi:hypothetical protein ASZ90_011116 [hydrocarbon metagenome]|uniref:Uncharacterized protein n=1 Tax=hydrocarbon metagenome TaxID=938273 RepID=A0A0W8FE62_9ZZZZ